MFKLIAFYDSHIAIFFNILYNFNSFLQHHHEPKKGFYFVMEIVFEIDLNVLSFVAHEKEVVKHQRYCVSTIMTHNGL